MKAERTDVEGYAHLADDVLDVGFRTADLGFVRV